MRNILTHVLIAGLVGLSVAAFGAEHPELQAFPAAQEGLERFVIVLPEKERGEEDSFRVEIIVGKDMLTDGVNLVRLATTIETRVLAGWGYPYYEVAGSSETMSTMMAPPAGPAGQDLCDRLSRPRALQQSPPHRSLRAPRIRSPLSHLGSLRDHLEG